MATLLALAAAVLLQTPADSPVHHELGVFLAPDAHTLRVQDTLTVPPDLRAAQGVTFRLHDGLAPRVAGDAFRLIPEAEGTGHSGSGESGDEGVPVRRYRLLPTGAWPADGTATIEYQGPVFHPLEQEEEEAARSFSRSPGLITAEGVVLSGSTFWVPAVGERLVTFRLTVAFAGEGWTAVSQGTRTHRDPDTWDSPEPMDEVYLIAAPFTEYSRPAGAAVAEAFLRTPDPALAAKYLEATAQYLDMYGHLIGPYPYGKFALVENFWETGYGMPSFTLLGSQVIRLPFILHSSYPHEILHNWWGNSVFVDWSEGNWCEGLTAYLADHLIKEGQGRGEEYRRDTLDKYGSYVQEAKDFPLVEFKSRHSPATEAVGYGKALMLFHMVRRRIGDDAFVQGLQRFYRQEKFRRATFGDLERAFTAASGEDLSAFFRAWTTRAGAPTLTLGDVEVIAAANGFVTTVEVRQTQADAPFPLSVPVAFTLEGEGTTIVRTLDMDGQSERLGEILPARPVRVEVDPQFDLFRRLDRAEIPASLAWLFGAPEVTVVLPADDPIPAAAWRQMTADWFTGQEERVEFVDEEALRALPEGRAVWILGRGNRHAAALAAALGNHGAGVAGDQATFGAERVPVADHCFVYVTRRADAPDLAIGWIGAGGADALPGLGRKLPHYGKYSYLAFAGAEPTNVVKGQWTAAGSPLVKELDAEGAPFAAHPAREPLARLAPVFDPARMQEHVARLASPAWQGRGVGTAGLEEAAAYLADQFRAMGLAPGGDAGGFVQEWSEPDGPEGKAVTLRNIIGVIPGTDPARAGESVVIGAHYDHLGLGWPDARTGNAGKVHPGADDNASGVAVMLEVAALLAGDAKPARTLVFVAFSGEEWGLKGSRHYVKAMARWPVAQCLAMVNLDTVGRLGAGKILVLGSGSATEWMPIAMGVGFTTGVESTCVADDLGSSDQRSFLEAGVPAVQLFSGPNEDYHRPSDTADRIDADGMVKVATFLRETVAYLGDRAEPLTSTLTPGGLAPAAPREGSARKVSLGTMPDFAFGGPGVKVAAVIDGSPAAQAGIAVGDVILEFAGRNTPDLQAYSDALKSCAPGDVVKLRLQRGGEEVTLEATLVAR